MKLIYTIVLVLFCGLNSLKAQDTIQKKKIYRTWISLNNESNKIRGFLYEANDSSILVSRSLVIKGYSPDRSKMVNLNIINIETIKIRKNNNVGKGFLFGTLTGFALGGLIGLISGDDPPEDWFAFTAGEKAILLGVPFGVIGAILGGEIGTIKLKIPINGSMNNYNRNKNKLRGYSIN